ncbi:hypothetical protein FACS189459_5370 [Bacilli bacterium]|nr:hypothetical protein FACS189459_5370 [Bacilli bacterium]GHU51774.1 hypothetical protein FACS189496_0770 [Bacilli bacterium]
MVIGEYINMKNHLHNSWKNFELYAFAQLTGPLLTFKPENNFLNVSASVKIILIPMSLDTKTIKTE